MKSVGFRIDTVERHAKIGVCFENFNLGLRMDKPDDLLLSVKQVAETLDVSTVQVTRYHKQGLLPFIEAGNIGCGVIRMTPLSAVKGFVRPSRGRPRLEDMEV